MRSILRIFLLCTFFIVIGLTPISADLSINDDKLAHLDAQTAKVTEKETPPQTITDESPQTTKYNYIYNYAVIPTTETPSNQNLRESSVIILIPTSLIHPTGKGNKSVQLGLNVTTMVREIITPLYKPTPFHPFSNASLLYPKWTPSKRLLPTPYPKLTNKTISS